MAKYPYSHGRVRILSDTDLVSKIPLAEMSMNEHQVDSSRDSDRQRLMIATIVHSPTHLVEVEVIGAIISRQCEGESYVTSLTLQPLSLVLSKEFIQFFIISAKAARSESIAAAKPFIKKANIDCSLDYFTCEIAREYNSI